MHKKGIDLSPQIAFGTLVAIDSIFFLVSLEYNASQHCDLLEKPRNHEDIKKANTSRHPLMGIEKHIFGRTCSEGNFSPFLFLNPV